MSELSEEERNLISAIAQCHLLEKDIESDLAYIERLKAKYGVPATSQNSSGNCSLSSYQAELDSSSDTEDSLSWIQRSPSDIRHSQNNVLVKLIKVKRELEGILTTIDLLKARHFSS